MPIYSLDGVAPEFADRSRAWLAPSAEVMGRVRIGLDVSLWFGTVVRADNDLIELGDGCNVQDGAMVHADPGTPTSIGAGCTIGHHAIIHGATIGANSLVGMGATILNRAVIGENSLVGANALVTEGKVFPPGSLIVGAPAKLARPLTDAEIAGLRLSAASYVANGRRFAAGLHEISPSAE
ncbi:gamma carbonic anhydrase family protein [Glacieibacterium sp.]|uniref:gamma carbonic anhydrase family protein n=1 Tax=Glacieibacterium sp. TaxID=2860237 RepID=UPI003AFFAF4C